MKYGSVAVAYKEGRLLPLHLQHIPKWVDRKTVLISASPWFGSVDTNYREPEPTMVAAESFANEAIRSVWQTEQDQRNFGQAFNQDMDWVIVLDPDEFLSDEDWKKLKKFLETTKADAVVAEGQYTYWKNGYVADPPKDYQMLIAVRPHIMFVDKRVVDSSYVAAPVWVHHMSWARTDQEIWNKISHYAHAQDFDTKKWYEEVWKKWKPGMQNVHPTTPETLHNLIPAQLPKELERLGLWPK